MHNVSDQTRKICFSIWYYLLVVVVELVEVDEVVLVVVFDVVLVVDVVPK